MQKAKGGRLSSGLADDGLNGEPHLIDRKGMGLSPMAYELNHTVKSFQKIIETACKIHPFLYVTKTSFLSCSITGDSKPTTTATM